MKRRETDGLLKIGELARCAGVGVSTVKYYISQGLLEPELKTSANMAYYNPSCVERILLIKQLQKEKFYPLSLIGELLSGKKDAYELDLYNAIHKISPEGGREPLPAGRAAFETGLTQKQIDALLQHGVIEQTRENGRDVFSARDVSIMQLVKRRCDAGLPFEQTLESFTIYAGAIDLAASRDVDVMIQRVVMSGTLSSAAIASLIRTADATLDEFVSLKRDSLDSYYSSLRLKGFLDYIAELSRFRAWLPELSEMGEASRHAASVLTQLETMQEDLDIAGAGALLRQADGFFSGMDVSGEPDGDSKKTLYALRLGFYYLAPEVFGWKTRAEKYADTLAEDVAEFVKEGGAAGFKREVLERLRTLKAQK